MVLAAQHLLAVVAHPDDETFGMGSLLGMATRAGVRVTVACATRGEAGDPVPGSVGEGRNLAEVREEELREAAAMLGVGDVVAWDWHDSDMAGDPAPGTLCAAPIDEVVSTVAALVEERRPTMVVTLDGSDGHRDHVCIRDATLAAVDATTWQPDRVYLHCLPQRLMRRWVEEVARRDPDAAHLALGELGTPDHEITTVVDTSDLLDLRERAMAVHATQVPPHDVMPPDVRHAFLVTDVLRRVRPPWPAGEPVETTLFAPTA